MKGNNIRGRLAVDISQPFGNLKVPARVWKKPPGNLLLYF
jgi:hypothetical protein